MISRNSFEIKKYYFCDQETPHICTKYCWLPTLCIPFLSSIQKLSITFVFCFFYQETVFCNQETLLRPRYFLRSKIHFLRSRNSFAINILFWDLNTLFGDLKNIFVIKRLTFAKYIFHCLFFIFLSYYSLKNWIFFRLRCFILHSRDFFAIKRPILQYFLLSTLSITFLSHPLKNFPSLSILFCFFFFFGQETLFCPQGTLLQSRDSSGISRLFFAN